MSEENKVALVVLLGMLVAFAFGVFTGWGIWA
jgi:hypothetical protein